MRKNKRLDFVILVMAIACVFSSVAVMAADKLPSGVFTFSELEKAKAEAVEKDRPIAFVLGVV